jgi:hypothetical protein
MHPTRPARDTAERLRETFASHPFTLSDAERAGVSRGRLRTAAASGTVQRLTHGLYVVPDSTLARLDLVESDAPAPTSTLTEGDEAHLRGLLMAHPGACASHETGALVQGLPILGPHRQLHVSGARLHGSVARGVAALHAVDIPTWQRAAVDGIPVTSLARTAVDCARRHSLAAGLVVADAAARRILLTQHAGDGDPRALLLDPDLRAAARYDLERVISHQSWTPYIRNARRTIEMCDPAAESAHESRSRAFLIQSGVPLPVCGSPVKGADGKTYWADMAWPDSGVIGECDGLGKYVTPDVLRLEKLRQEALEAAGWHVIRWTWHDLSPALVTRLIAALTGSATYIDLASRASS